MRNSQVPKARSEELVILEMPDELLVYDLKNNKVHCLNQSAMLVWKSCDGRRDISEIAETVKDHVGRNVNEDVVWMATDQLLDGDLLDGRIESGLEKQSRRAMIKKIGLASTVLLPMVSSIVAPPPAAAQSNACLCPGPGTDGNAACAAQSELGCGATCNAGGVCV